MVAAREGRDLSERRIRDRIALAVRLRLEGNVQHWEAIRRALAVHWRLSHGPAALRGVSINAKAEVHSDPDKVHGLAKQVMIRNNPDVPAEAMDQAAKQLAAKRSAIVVRLEKVVTWDHRKLGGGY